MLRFYFYGLLMLLLANPLKPPPQFYHLKREDNDLSQKVIDDLSSLH